MSHSWPKGPAFFRYLWIYDFYDKGQFYKFSLILIRNGDEYEILDIINMNRSQIRAKLKNYFHRHPDVSKNLFPVYANALNFLRKEHSLIARTWDIRIEKDDNNNSIYRYIYKPNDSFIEFEEIID